MKVLAMGAGLFEFEIFVPPSHLADKDSVDAFMTNVPGTAKVSCLVEMRVPKRAEAEASRGRPQPPGMMLI